MSEHVEICEVGPRDGLQMVKDVVPTETKLKWINQLLDAGLPEVEAGSFVPPRLVPQMADTDTVIRSLLRAGRSGVAALVPNLKGAQFAYEAGAEVVIIPVSVSDSHSMANTRKTTLDQVKEVGAIVDWVKSQPRAMRVDVGCATAFGCSMEGGVSQKKVVQTAYGLAQAGADRVVLADTVGYANPALVRSTIRAVRQEIGQVLYKLHLHDTLGMGLANAVAGLDEGIRCFDASLAGLGGCPFAPGATGNIVTEDLVYMVESMGMTTGISLDGLFEARKTLASALPNEPLHGNVYLAGAPRITPLP
ncbi:MAG TPA: hydroxymethylglutaryl-CoA lyase [Burkholderiaceae bacterium]|nr:hydroxymethylglutaryl-CoA lyase [Burkholderiaceae bacterium]